jgi:hypothetical protein
MYAKLAQVAREIEQAAPGFEVGWLDAFVWLRYGYIKHPSTGQIAEARREYWRFLQTQASRSDSDASIATGEHPNFAAYAQRHLAFAEASE